MKVETIERTALALSNASEFIRQHGEVGLSPEDVNEEDEKGLMEYIKACERAAKMIDKLAEKQCKNLIKCQQKQNM
ncbi:hypothetical protein CMU26_01020 [Elizabethkingia anophelis]|nr:hypothetical protein [Elizabethkingia anophelis]